MNELTENKVEKKGNDFSQQVARSVKRKLKARQRETQGVWFGLGMMGLIGWSVVVPTLFGAALGSWLDRRQLDFYSWTLTLMFVGLVIGCINAWHWVAKEDQAMNSEEEVSNE